METTIIRPVRTSHVNSFEIQLRKLNRKMKGNYELFWKVGAIQTIRRPISAPCEAVEKFEYAEVQPFHIQIFNVRSGEFTDPQSMMKIHDSQVIGHVDYLMPDNCDSDNFAGMIMEYGSVPVETRFRDRQVCDHCGHNRRRNRTYIVIHEGIQKQIGSTCVEQFFGMPVPYLPVFHDLIVSMKDDDCFSGGKGPDGFFMNDILPYVAGYLAKHPFINRARADEQGVNTTAQGILDVWNLAKLVKAAKIELTEWYGDSEIVMPAIKQANHELMIKFDDNPDELSSFEYTIAQIINFDFGFWKFFPHFVGYIAHIVGKYRKEQARAATLQYPAEIGERIKKVPVTVQSVKEFFGNYGSTFLIQFRTEESHALKTFYSGNDRFNEGDKVLLTGTVKAQEDNQYGKGTMLSRIKVDLVK